MEDSIENGELSEELPQNAETAAEENVSGLMPEVEHAHAPHGHGSGVPWLDVIVTVSVVFISVISLVVSIEHGKTMEKMVDQNQKMVEASTMPILNIAGSEFDTSGKPSFREVLSNGGAGPAFIDRFEIRYKGVVYTDEMALLRACCAAALLKSEKNGQTQIRFSNVSGGILPAREEIDPITIKPDKAGIDLFNTFNVVRDTDDITYHACYCSVLNECWETDFDRKRPQPVKECRVSPNEKLW
jgi:hypothetical protein